MANVNWQNYYAPSFGEANIIKGNPALDALKNQYAQQAADKAKEDAAFNASLAKMNFGGAKPADYSDLQKGFNDVVAGHQAVRAERDPDKRGLLNQALSAKMNDLLYKTAQSKQANQDVHKANELRYTHPDNLHPDFTTNLNGLANTSTFTPEFQSAQDKFNSSLFLPKTMDWNKMADDTFKGVLDKQTNSAIVKEPVTGQFTNQKTVSNKADKDAYLTSVATQLRDPMKFRAAQRDFGGNTPEEVVTNFVNSTYDPRAKRLHNDVTMGNPFETGAQKAARTLGNQKVMADYRKTLKDSPTAAHYEQDLSERMRTGTNGSGEEFSKYIENNPSYHKGLHIDTSDPAYISITVPNKMKQNTSGERVVDKPAYTVKLDKNDKTQWDAGFAKLYKDITGDKSGKGVVTNGVNPYLATPKQPKEKVIVIKGSNKRLW